MTRLARRLSPVVALALVSGCGDGHDREHDHDDHDHAEHVDPAHWPSDFPDAVDLLLVGHDATREALSAGRADDAHDRLLPIQRDLAKWLPEVAADSDMPEGPWARVDAIAARLLACYESALADLDAGLPVGGDRLAPASPALDDLRRLRDEADPSWFPRRRPSGDGEAEPEGHDHDDHDDGHHAAFAGGASAPNGDRVGP